MKSQQPQPLEAALAANSRMEMWSALRAVKTPLTLPDVNKLAAKLKTIAGQTQPIKLAIVRTYATELLKSYWTFESLLNGFTADVYEAPFGALFEESGTGLAERQPDVTYFMLRWEDLSPQLMLPVSGLSADDREALSKSAVDRVHTILSAFRKTCKGLAVVTLLPPMFGPELGQYDAMAADSQRAFFESTKSRIAKTFRDTLPSVHFEDLDALCEQVGRANLYDPRLWQTSRFPFTQTGGLALVRRLMTYAVLLKQPRIKVIALDADNTMWGGILGEDGINGIAIGQDYPGTSYVAFQRRILHYQQRGILLALCSKNNPGDVAEVLKNHPHQILRESHFAAVRVNWESKVENLHSLAKELNLGLDSFLFVDDSNHECFQVREQLPQVLVVQTPTAPVDVPFCIENIARLETLSLTKEDAQRSEMYASERQRKELAANVTDHGQYLQSLKMVMTVSFNDAKHLARIAQLTQKTNQFNTTTRRYLDADIAKMMEDPDCLVADFSLADVFGDSGIVGVALVKGLTSPTPEIDTFLMSCRVIGRGAEDAFLRTVLDHCKSAGATTVKAEFIQTAKNDLVKTFWPDRGFTHTGGTGYQLNLSTLKDETTSAIKIVIVGNPTAAVAARA